MSNRQRSPHPLPAELQFEKTEFLALLNLVRAVKEGRVGSIDADLHLEPVLRWKLAPRVADLLTMTEHFDGRLEDIACCYIGDGCTTVAGRLLVIGALLGMDMRIAAPRQLWPADALIDAAEDLAAESGARLLVTSDAGHAVLGADFLYTDAWTRFAEAPEVRAERFELLEPFQVTSALIASTGKATTKVLHRSPWRLRTWLDLQSWSEHGRSDRAPELAEDVLASNACLLTEQAENRLQATKALIAARLPELPAPRSAVRTGAGRAPGSVR